MQWLLLTYKVERHSPTVEIQLYCLDANSHWSLQESRAFSAWPLQSLKELSVADNLHLTHLPASFSRLKNLQKVGLGH